MSEQAQDAISVRIGRDIITAMKAKDEHRLTTLRMVKSAMKNKEIDKREPLTEAAKEKVEIGMIEGYLPQEASEEDVRAIIMGSLNHLAEDAGGVRPGPRDMGTAMKVVKQRLLASGIRADGKVVSDILKAELNK
jgi:uncharacterized protein YqeY